MDYNWKLIGFEGLATGELRWAADRKKGEHQKSRRKEIRKRKDGIE